MLHAARRPLAIVSTLSGALAVTGPANAQTAAAQECQTPNITISVPADPEWEPAAEDLTEHLRALRYVDQCARIVVRPNDTGVVVEVSTSDGRHAVRQVDSEPALVHTVEALLVLPPPLPAQPGAPSPAELPPHDAPPPPRAASATTHVELGVGGSLRFGGGPLYVGGGAAGFAQFTLDHWLIAVSGRWDAADAFLNEPTPSGFSMQSSAVGVSVGHRLERGTTNLDALFGPSIVLEDEDADDGEREIHGAAADFRLALGLRVSGPRAASLRAFAAADLECSPARLRSRRFVDHSLPQLPWWSTGLAVGVLWGAR